MAIEEEFGIEIPDAEADEITTVQQGKSILCVISRLYADEIAVEYIAKVRYDVQIASTRANHRFLPTDPRR
jgi:hypothetical protein